MIAWTSVLEGDPAEVGLRVGAPAKEVVVQCLGPGLIVLVSEILSGIRNEDDAGR